MSSGNCSSYCFSIVLTLASGSSFIPCSQVSSHLKLQGDLTLSLYSFLLSEVLPHKIYSPLFSQLNKATAFLWVPTLCVMAWDTLQAIRWYNLWAHLVCVLFSRIAVLSCICPISENSHLMYFVQFSSCLQWEGNCCSSLPFMGRTKINTFWPYTYLGEKTSVAFVQKTAIGASWWLSLEGLTPTSTKFQFTPFPMCMWQNNIFLIWTGSKLITSTFSLPRRRRLNLSMAGINSCIL